LFSGVYSTQLFKELGLQPEIHLKAAGYPTMRSPQF